METPGFARPTDAAFQNWLQGISNDNLPYDVEPLGPDCDGTSPTPAMAKWTFPNNFTEAEKAAYRDLYADIRRFAQSHGFSVDFVPHIDIR